MHVFDNSCSKGVSRVRAKAYQIILKTFEHSNDMEIRLKEVVHRLCIHIRWIMSSLGIMEVLLLLDSGVISCFSLFRSIDIWKCALNLRIQPCLFFLDFET